LRTRIIVFSLIVTQCLLAGCNLRNPPQRQTPQDDPFSTQEPFATPTRSDTERNRDSNTERGTGGTERNRDGINERDRNDTERDRDGINERDRNDRERDRENNNTERNRGEENSRRKRIHCNGFVNQIGVCQTN
jgi:hypothetical protein